MIQTDKLIYQQPEVVRIQLDNTISLVLLSPPLGPGDENIFELPYEDPIMIP